MSDNTFEKVPCPCCRTTVESIHTDIRIVKGNPQSFFICLSCLLIYVCWFEDGIYHVGIPCFADEPKERRAKTLEQLDDITLYNTQLLPVLARLSAYLKEFQKDERYSNTAQHLLESLRLLMYYVVCAVEKRIDFIVDENKG